MTGRRLHVRVIEDEPETRAQIIDALDRGGSDVDDAITGDEGFNRARPSNYAVMTVDRMLHGMGGIAPIRRLRDEGVLTPALIAAATRVGSARCVRRAALLAQALYGERFVDELDPGLVAANPYGAAVPDSTIWMDEAEKKMVADWAI